MAGPFGNLGNMAGIMKQAQKAMEEMKRMQEELENERIESSSGGGMVTATVTGSAKLVDIKIDPQVVDPDDLEMLQDLVVTAVREAQQKAEEARVERVQSLTGGMNIPGLF